MKKLSMILSVLCIATLVAVPAFAQLAYQIDVGQNGTFETGGSIDLTVGASVTIDIYVDGYSCPPDDKLFGTLKYIFVDESQVTISGYPFDSNHGGPFDPSLSGFLGGGINGLLEPNVYSLSPANFFFVTVAGNKQKLGTITLTCISTGTFDLVVANDLTAYGYSAYADGYVADCNLSSQFPADAVLTINQNQPTVFPEVATTCPEVETNCPVVATTCPEGVTTCPVIATTCPETATVCPEEATLCPQVATVCPEAVTNCPVQATVCPIQATVCPVGETFCPAIPTVCPESETTCPIVETSCPTGVTFCPANPTFCPEIATICPETATVCPEEATFCPQVATVCPEAVTNCPVQATVCPIQATVCPTGETFCPAIPTVCPESETTCPIVETSCPSGETFCPITPTFCPAVETSCPELETECPANVCPLAYKFDFNGDRHWDTEWELTPPDPPAPGETVQVDIWLNGYVCPPDDDLFGVQLYFVYDPGAVQVNQAYSNDTNHGGPFDPFLSGFIMQEPGIYKLFAAEFNFVSVIGNRILLGTIELQCIDAGSNLAIVAANDLGFDPYADGYISDCLLGELYPLEAIAIVYQTCSSDADCDDGNQCTEEYCDAGTDSCVYTVKENGTPCDDGFSCNDPDFCVDGKCVASIDQCCEVTIDPKQENIYFGETIQFTATEEGDCNPTPCYTWEITAAGGTGNTATGTGGQIDPQSGLYTAGNNAGTDIVKVTDKCSSGEPVDRTTVTVSKRPKPPVTTSIPVTTTTTTIKAPCVEDAACDDELFCNGNETCVSGVCQPGTAVNCPDDGQFCNGTESCSEQADACVSSGNPCGAGTVCSEETNSCEQQVTARIKELLPPSWFQSRWFPLIRQLRIIGSDTNFEEDVSIVTFEPVRAVWGFRPQVADEENILMGVLILPQWFSRPLEGPVQVTVTTGSEVVSVDWDIELLPFPLDQEGQDLQ